MSSPEHTMLQQQVVKYGAALKVFSASPSKFRILKSIPGISLPSEQKIDALYILDSSFNPPTLAHLRIATSAILQDTQCQSRNKRLLLLLATQNADKAPKPASFEQRLIMMDIFATDLLKTLEQGKQGHQQEEGGAAGLGIDIGVTTLPYFVEKAITISESGLYPPSTPQVHLTGYDTLIRIMNPKYYPPSHDLAVLAPFLQNHRLRVTYRADDSWGSRAEQDDYLKGILEGKLESIGGKREWVEKGRIELVEGRKEGEEVISSTRVRDAVKAGDKGLLEKLVTSGVAEWILKQDLYRE